MLEFAKLVHQIIGVSSPRLFIMLFALSGLVLFGGVGWLIDKGYRMQLAKESSRVIQPDRPIQKAVNSIAPEIGYQKNRITIQGPDGMRLLVYLSNGNYFCKVLNGSLSIVEQIHINITATRTFDAERLLWRNPVPLRSLMGPTRGTTDPGEYTQEFNFATHQGEFFRLGDDSNSLLKWPSGDQNPIHRWRIIMTVRAIRPTKDWPVDLCIRWTPDTKSFDFMEYGNSIPLASF
jgi:hypothetical protein